MPRVATKSKNEEVATENEELKKQLEELKATVEALKPKEKVLTPTVILTQTPTRTIDQRTKASYLQDARFMDLLKRAFKFAPKQFKLLKKKELDRIRAKLFDRFIQLVEKSYEEHGEKHTHWIRRSCVVIGQDDKEQDARDYIQIVISHPAVIKCAGIAKYDAYQKTGEHTVKITIQRWELL
jgi:hypothetical protein